MYICNWQIKGILWLKTHYFSQFITKMGFCCKNFKFKRPLPRVWSVDREPIVYHVYNENEATRVQTCDDDTSLFPAKPASR